MLNLDAKLTSCNIVNVNNEFQAENELRYAQADYDKQVEITRLLMEGLASIQGCQINNSICTIDNGNPEHCGLNMSLMCC